MILSKIQQETFVFFPSQVLPFFRGFKSSLVVNSQVTKPERVALSKVFFKRLPYDNDWPISLGDLNLILGA